MTRCLPCRDRLPIPNQFEAQGCNIL
jgi:hypothetical protein